MSKKFKKGQQVIWHVNAFGLHTDVKCAIKFIKRDCVIAECTDPEPRFNGLLLRIDESTEDDFCLA